MPRGTGTPYFLKISLPWYSWIFMVLGGFGRSNPPGAFFPKNLPGRKEETALRGNLGSSETENVLVGIPPKLKDFLVIPGMGAVKFGQDIKTIVPSSAKVLSTQSDEAFTVTQYDLDGDTQADATLFEAHREAGPFDSR